MADLSQKEFLLQLEQLNVKLRADIEAKQRSLDPSPLAIRQRRYRVLVEMDFEYFVYTYFPHHMWLDEGQTPSSFQTFFYNRFPKALTVKGGLSDWYIAPRGEAKSTLLTKIGPCFVAVLALLQDSEVRAELGTSFIPYFIDYLIFFGAEANMPAALVEVVKTELTSNSMLALDFPEACGATHNWKIGDMTTASGVKMQSKGANQAVRGTFFGSSRPKLLLGDDLITDAEAKSPTVRESRWDWLQKSVDFLGPPDGSVKFMCVNTVLNDDDPISRAKHTPGNQVHHFKALETMPERMDLWGNCEELMRNTDALVEKEITAKGDMPDETDLPSFKFWLRHKKKLSKGAKVSWSSVRSLYTLMKMRVKNLKAFNTEMQGIARNDEDRVFTSWKFWVNKLHGWLPYGGCDPSMGKNESADPSAIATGWWCPVQKILYVDEVLVKRRVPSKLRADLVKQQKANGIIIWGFENNNSYEYMRISFIKDSLLEGVTLPMRGVTATISQLERIESLEPLITGLEPRILFSSQASSQITDELETFPEKQQHHHYDGLCAVHVLWMIASTGAGGIPRVHSASVDD